MVPDFILPISDGREFQVSRYRGRRDLVLIFVGADTSSAADLLRGLVAQRSELDYEETVVAVIVERSQVEAEALRKRDGLPFIVLADSDGSVTGRFGTPSVYITDRYGEIYSTQHLPLPSADEVLKSLSHINAQCAE